MTRTAPAHAATTLDRIKHSLVGLRMPRALEVLDATVRRIEQGEIDGITALDEILMEELRPCSTACCITPSSSRSRGRATGCASTAISSPSTSVRRR
ncbi:hypothetical protein ABIC30_000019 [Methylobacterium sp. 1030]